MQSCPLAAANFYPSGYTLELFKSNRPSGALSVGNYALRNAVVDVSSESSFFPASGYKKPPSRLRALRLELRPKPTMASPKPVGLSTRIESSIRVGGNVLDTEVNAQHALNVLRYGFLNIAGSKQVETATQIAKVRFALLGFEEGGLMLTANERYQHSTGSSPNRNRALVNVPAENPLVVGNRAGRLESALALLVQLVGIGDLGNGTDGHLRRQARRSSERIVELFLKRPLAERLVLPYPLANLIADGVSLGKSVAQCLGLFGRGIQFNLSGQFHRHIIPESQALSQYNERRTALDGLGSFPPRSKETGLPRPYVL